METDIKDRVALRWNLKRIVLAPARLIDRSQGIWRTLVIAAYLMATLLIATFSYRQTQLLSLPDVGDPFNVSEFLAFSIPDDQNAVLPYLEAVKLYKPPPDRSFFATLLRIPGPNSPRLSPEARLWLESNRPALQQFRAAWEFPDAFDPAAQSQKIAGFLDPEESYTRFCSAALLEADRLMEEGDLAATWDWYHSVLRSTWLIGRHTGEGARQLAVNIRSRVSRRLKIWTEDPRVDPATLRKALADIQACESLFPSDVATLQVAYLAARQAHERFYEASAEVDSPPPDPDRFQLPKPLSTYYNEVKRWLRRDRERSRRVLNLAFRNWIEYSKLATDARPKPVIRVKVGPRLQGTPADFFPIEPQAGGLPPMALARWYATTIDLRPKLATLGYYQGQHSQDLHAHASQVMMIAEELYSREHGDAPDSPQKLVGSGVLRRLPDFGTYFALFVDVPFLVEEQLTETDQD